MLQTEQNPLGARVRDRRKSLGLTQEGLAVKAGLTLRTVTRVEAGTWPSHRTLAALALALGCTMGELLEGAAA